MQFKNIFLAASAFAAALANVQFTNSNFDLVAGQPFVLTWSGAEGPVTVLLKDGASTDLKTVQTLGSGLTANSLVFTPSTSLTTDFYAFEIQDSNKVPNYSQQFLVSGATGSPSSAASSSAAVSTTATTATSTVSAISTSSALSSSAVVSSTSASNSSASASTTATGSSSAASTTTTDSSSSSATESASKSGNTTLSTTHSKTSASNTASGTTAPATSAPTSSAAGLSSPLAFVFLALAAIVMLN